jgi:hypothetical protein
MLKARNLFILVAITAAVVVAAAYSLRPSNPLPRAGSLVFPGLLERINDVDGIEVTAGGATFALRRGQGGWVAPDRGDHPLDADMVHTLLVGTSGLTYVEPQTSNPELYARLGVEDPDSEATASVQVRLAAAGQPLAELIIGESKPAKGDPGAFEYSVRRPGDAQTWLTQGRLPEDAGTVVDWLDGGIAEISADRFMRAHITHPDGSEVSVEKDKPGPGNFALVGAPGDVTAKDVWRLNDIGRLLADLSLEDVRGAAESAASFGGEVRVFESRTFDGLAVRAEVVELSEDEHLMRLQASFDEEQAARGKELGSDALRDEAAVREEVSALNARWQPWVYVIPRYKASYLDKRMADLLPEPEQQPKPEATGGSG